MAVLLVWLLCGLLWQHVDCQTGAAFQAAIDSAAAASSARSFASAAEDRAAFDAGIDRVSPAATDPAGPQFVTNPTAQAIGRVGLAFLDTAITAADMVNITGAARAGAFGGAAPAMAPFPCPFVPPLCDPSARFRTMDGTCNNLNFPLWGRSNTPFDRYLFPVYSDGLSAPRLFSVLGGFLPNPRRISVEYHDSLLIVLPDLTHMTMQFGQFLSHDVEFQALTKGFDGSNLDCCELPNRPGCFPIRIPQPDPVFPPMRTCMNFVRALPTPNLQCTLGVRQQLNQITHYIDGSMIYGSTDNESEALRDIDGLMLVSPGDLLPTHNPTDGAECEPTNPVTRPCFVAGDKRVNEQPMLATMHTIWVREHNYVASRLALLHPDWDPERLFQEARRIVIAEVQHITYNEWLREMLGFGVMQQYDLLPRIGGYYQGYSAFVRPMIRSGFSTSAFRVGHSFLFNRVTAHDGVTFGPSPRFRHVFNKPDYVYEQGIGRICKGLSLTAQGAADRHITREVTSHLFEKTPGFGMDLAATNIQRGRDFGIPGYQAYRQWCGLSGPFSHTADNIARLNSIYRHPADIDLFTGGVSEIPLPGAKVGPTFACLFARQFRALKRGDRFFYENAGPLSFSPDQLADIRSVTLAAVICRNSDIGTVQPRILRHPGPGNEIVDCATLRHLDLTMNGPWAGGFFGGGPGIGPSYHFKLPKKPFMRPPQKPHWAPKKPPKKPYKKKCIPKKYFNKC